MYMNQEDSPTTYICIVMKRNYKMKRLFKSTKVIYDAHEAAYFVYYKNWFFWVLDSCYKFDTIPGLRRHDCNKQQAEKQAIERAEAMLETVEVFRKTVFMI